MVLIAGDYGYHVGNIIWRGRFNATGTETGIYVNLWGGLAFSFSIWLDEVFIGSWEGGARFNDYNSTFRFTDALGKGQEYVLTILQDHMGYEMDPTVAGDMHKKPRGILDYFFTGAQNTSVEWKVTGNLGGEDVGFPLC